MRNDMRFRNTWLRQRHDLKDQSNSGYDMALACFGAAAGLPEQQIVDIIVHHRAHHGREQRTRLDYFQRTIAKAGQRVGGFGVDTPGTVGVADHVYAGVADVNAELEEFTVDAKALPKRVVAAHPANQFAYFHRHGRATGLDAADLPSPEQSDSFAVPSYDGSRFDDAQSRAPFGPGSTKPSRNRSNRFSFGFLTDRCIAKLIGGGPGSQSAMPLVFRKTDRVDASNGDNTAVGGN